MFLALRESDNDIGPAHPALDPVDPGINATLLAGYTFGCHSWRHLIGGKMDCFSCSRRAQVRYAGWRSLTSLNRHHMFWAWASLLTVTFADVYVRLLALGIITDPAIRF